MISDSLHPAPSPANPASSTKHTYEMGLIGNCAFLALIRKDASMAWLCWPRFDSSFVFGSLLDANKGGEFSIRPAAGANFSSHQYYLENTNVLCTELTTPDGRYRVTDFAPRFSQYERYYKPLMFIRKVEPMAGAPRIRVTCDPVGEYGTKELSRRRSSNHIAYLGLEEEIRLTTNIPLTYVVDEEDFALNETKYLVLTYGAPLEAPLESTAERFLSSTVEYWRKWVKSMSIGDFYQGQVIRSALALKVHQYEDTGAIIAASTTSLPEAPGSTRNWDYRYCWMRDTYYILTAFNNIGHFEEMERYFHYIANISTKVKGKYQPLYGISGASELVEQELDLAGYMGNLPVRIGNDAYTHVQNDVYGQVLVALLPLYVDHRFVNPERTSSETLMYEALGLIKATMDVPDAGLWEFRNLAQYHCYTYLFHWAGSHAARKVARALGNKAMEALATELNEEATRRIEQCYNPDLGAYTNAIGSPHLDASTLQLILMGYLDPNSERARQHLIALENELKTPEGLFYRYRHADDFGTPETTFLICSFWYVEALACVGRLTDAIREFEKLISYANHLGLLSEDVDAKTGSQWGNFPQAYSHVGLMNAAYRIAKKLDKPNFI
ncbi:glycoside hydrolase family 15 protein [Hymenobacter sp. BT770]|uniref:glycoside hydrolase family 15 protein n=1 Tax=Hymenobacter sp. BT770 TaxID=2886942 RepID=UPI001D12788B|nr:glycoside hydrolase family 15 protein [Hymenobacter sp. BT770]MCC3152505.1 glycoside hydrolase family 15 protein [Hymenobacter sp. BT770]MDO3414519.1 glycoside hydrolase family 15 protein [Hymenobacter sp. BT770]